MEMTKISITKFEIGDHMHKKNSYSSIIMIYVVHVVKRRGRYYKSKEENNKVF